jgi:hypothetical protein
MTSSVNTWRFYHAPGTESSVEVYVRDPSGGGERADQALWLRGPLCELTHMLSATFRLQPVAPGLWRTTVIDPCYWTPVSPAYYRLEADGAPDAEASTALDVALRRLQVQGRHLIMDGRRWVFRGANAAAVSREAMAAYHELLLGLVVGEPDEALLEAASRRGVPVMLEFGEQHVTGRWSQAVRWPAVQLALLAATASATADQLATLAPNLVRVARMADRPMPVPAWAHAALCDADQLADTVRASPADASRRPLLVMRPGALQWNAAPARHPVEIRRACERFQQELGAAFNISGYLV